MNKYLLALFIFLFAGLYIDVRTDSQFKDSLTICNGSYLQRTFIVQTIIPFRSKRETFYFGIGNLHFNRRTSLGRAWCNSSTKQWESPRVYEEGCYPLEVPNVGKHAHYINLNPFAKKIQDPAVFTVDFTQVPNEEQFNYYKESWTKSYVGECNPR